MTKAKKMIYVTFQKEGIHKYPDAASLVALDGVSFLAHAHRHIFHFRVAIEVFHGDRDIEFILFKRELEKLYNNETLQLDNKSCEMMADDLHEYLAKTYPGRDVEIQVSEDGENGCICFYPAEQVNDISVSEVIEGTNE